MAKTALERIYPDDNTIRPQTIAHHQARYDFAVDITPHVGVSLDLCCGSGYGTEKLRAVGFDAVGIDKDSDAIKYAKSHYPKCSFFKSKLQNAQFPPADLITFFEGLEHFTKEDGIEIIGRASAKLKAGGTFILSIPRDINEDNNGFHLSRWTFDEVKKVMESKFKVVVIIGQDWDTSKFSSKSPETNDFFIAICHND